MYRTLVVATGITAVYHYYGTRSSYIVHVVLQLYSSAGERRLLFSAAERRAETSKLRAGRRAVAVKSGWVGGSQAGKSGWSQESAAWLAGYAV